MVQMFLAWSMALLVLGASVLETAGTGLRTARRGDDDGGDDGGGLGGALMGLMGGGGGGGGGDDGADNDDDPNMVGGAHKKKKAKGSNGGIDVSGLEKTLQTGGVNQLTAMLKMMQAAHSNGGGAKIIKGPDGEDIYDFRDLDESPTSTMKPITMPTEPPLTAPPKPLVELPEMPKITMGKNGQILGLNAAEAQVASATQKTQPAPPPQPAPSQSPVSPKQLVVWPPPQPAPQSQAQIAQTIPAVAAQAIPAVAPQAQPMPVGVPMMFNAPSVPMAQISTAGVNQNMAMLNQNNGLYQGMAMMNQNNGLYQGMAMLNQNMNMLMGQMAAFGGQANAEPAQLETKIEQESQTFLSYQHTMEGRVKALEDKNSAMRKQIAEQAREIKAMEIKAGARGFASL